MQTLHDWSTAAMTYIVAVLSMVYEFKDQTMFWLGLILLITRLVYELPRAVAAIRKNTRK